MPSSPSSKTWNSPQGPAPMIATVVAGSPSGPTCIGIRGGMEVLALRCQLIDEAFELGHPALGGADGHAVLAARVPAGLSGIQPILQCTGQKPVSDVPEVGVLVLVCQAVAKVHCLGKSRIESIGKFSHGGSIEQLAHRSAKRPGCAAAQPTAFAMPATVRSLVPAATWWYWHGNCNQGLQAYVSCCGTPTVLARD